jgi:hypothetical protein
MSKINSVLVLLVVLLTSCAHGFQVKTDPSQVTVKVKARFNYGSKDVPCDPIGMQLDVYTDYGIYLGTVPELICVGNSLEGLLTLPAGRYSIAGSVDTYSFVTREELMISGVTGQVANLVLYLDARHLVDESEEYQRSYRYQAR